MKLQNQTTLLLIPNSSRQTALLAAEESIKNPKHINEFIKIAFSEKKIISTRAANVIEKTDEKKPNIIKPFYSKIIETIMQCQNNGTKRCLLKMLMRHVDEVNHAILGRFVSFCFSLLISNKEEIGVRHYALQIILHVSKQYPELNSELFLVLDELKNHSSISLRSQSQEIIKKLKISNYEL